MIIFSRKPSRNIKLSRFDEFGIPQKPYVFTTYREVGSTCHTRCGFHPDHDDPKIHGHRCYALSGNVGVHSRRAVPDQEDGKVVYERVLDLPTGAMVRLHVSGDFYIDGVLDEDYFNTVAAAFTERPDVLGWTYTHAPLADLLWMRQRAPRNLAINWSLDRISDSDKYPNITGRTVVIPKQYNPKVNRIKGLAMCPAQTHDIPCSECKLCFNDQRKSVVGFYAHK